MSLTRKEFLGLSTSLMAVSLVRPKVARALGARRPNILVVVTDDQRTADLEVMPNVNRMIGSRGVEFTNAFVTDPLCGPSRATILTGQYPWNHDYRANSDPLGGEAKFRSEGRDRSTVATWLKSAGYATALFGKYLNGYGEPEKNIRDTYVPPGWDRWFGRLGGDYGPDGMYHYNDDGKPTVFDPDKRYSCDIECWKALQWIKGQEGPFFCYWAPSPPHQPAIPDPRDTGKYQGIRLPRPASFNEKDVSDKPGWVRELPSLSRVKIAYMRDLYENRLESLQAVDRQIPRLIQALESTGQLQNTYIIFTTDHGFHLGEHRFTQGKRLPYEEDYSIPLLVRGPGVPEGKKLTHHVLNNDLAPTLADIACTVAPDADGKSFLRLLGVKPPRPDRWRCAWAYSQLESTAQEGAIVAPTFYGVRTPNFTYTYYPDTGEEEVYYVPKDPYQLDNLVNTVSETTLQRLRSRRDALVGCKGASCKTAEVSS